MKNLRSLLLSSGALLLVLQFAFVSPAAAQQQSAQKIERERLDQLMQPGGDIEAFRREFMTYLDEFEYQMSLVSKSRAVREKLSQNGQKPLEKFAEAKREVAAMSYEDLSKMRAAYAKFPNWRETSQFLSPALRQKLEQASEGNTVNVADDCEDGIDADISNTDISIAKALLFVAEGVMEALPTDGITIAARLIPVGLYTAAQEAVLALETLKNIKDDCNENTFQTDIKNQVANSTNTITSAVNSAKTDVINNDNANKNTIVTTVDNAKTAIVNNDNANKDTIVTAVNNAKTQIIVNANANKDELIRLHIAADLASVDSATSVAAFMLPAVKGGYLELTRTIVAQAIANLAGSKTSQANSILAQADAAAAAGDYKAAYALYRKAYKTATN